MQSLPSLTLLSVAAALGQIRGAATSGSAHVVDDALSALSEGDTAPALAVLCRASLGLKDGPLREVIVAAFDALPEVEAELAEALAGSELTGA